MIPALGLETETGGFPGARRLASLATLVGSERDLFSNDKVKSDGHQCGHMHSRTKSGGHCLVCAKQLLGKRHIFFVMKMSLLAITSLPVVLSGSPSMGCRAVLQYSLRHRTYLHNSVTQKPMVPGYVSLFDLYGGHGFLIAVSLACASFWRCAGPPLNFPLLS